MQLETFEWPTPDDPGYQAKREQLVRYLNDRCLPKFHKDLSLRASVITRNLEKDHYEMGGGTIKDNGALLGAVWSALYIEEMKGE